MLAGQQLPPAPPPPPDTITTQTTFGKPVIPVVVDVYVR
jgi:hypothetical protein